MLTDKRSTDQSTSIIKWKCGARGVKPRWSPAQTSRADDDNRGIHGTYWLRVCSNTQPKQLHTNDENSPIPSSWNQKFLTKPSNFKKIHRREWRPKKSDLHGSATSIPVPTGVPVNRIWTGF